MAEKKILIYQCDRCGHEHRRSTRGVVASPKGWIEVLNRDICNVCVPDLESWLDNRPVINLGAWVGNAPDGPVTVPPPVGGAEAAPIMVHVHQGVDPTAPSVERVLHQWGPMQS